MEPSRNISRKIFKKFDVHLRSSTKHFQKHFSSRFIVTRIIDSNWHKSLFNSSRPMLYHRYLLTYYLSYEIFGGENCLTNEEMDSIRFILIIYTETRITYSTSCCAQPLGSVALWVHRSGSLEFAIYCGRDLSGDSTGLAWLKFYGHSPCIYSSRGQNYSTKDYVNINSRWSNDTSTDRIHSALLCTLVYRHPGRK